MIKVIKNNIVARHTSLLENTQTVSLFNTNTINGQALYLQHHQTQTFEITQQKSLLLSVFQGSGELEIRDNNQTLDLPINTGDIVVMAEPGSYQITNTNTTCLMVSIVEYSR